MNVWGILFSIVLVLWLLIEYIILMAKLRLEYLIVVAIKKKMMQDLSKVGENLVLSNREIKNVINKIEKEISIHDYSEWISFKKTFKNKLAKALTKCLLEKIKEKK